MTGRGWQLNGRIHKFMKAQAKIQTMDICHLNLHEMMQQTGFAMNQSLIELPVDYSFDGLNDFVDMHVSKDDNYSEIWVGHNVAWTNTAITVILIIILIIIARYLYLRRMKIRFFLKDAIQPKVILNKKGDAIGVKYDKESNEVKIEEINVPQTSQNVTRKELSETLGNMPQ
jgi:hypothetical protein